MTKIATVIPTVEEYQRCNYLPETAFYSVVRICEQEVDALSFRLRELAVGVTLFGDWEDEGAWGFVQEYVELAQDLQAINEKWMKT